MLEFMFILEFILVMLNPRRVVLISRGPCELKHHRSQVAPSTWPRTPGPVASIRPELYMYMYVCRLGLSVFNLAGVPMRAYLRLF